MSWKDPRSRRDIVYLLLMMVPMGYTVTYGALAELCVTSPRVVGIHMRQNKDLVIVPCHRVVSTRGLGGFSRGLEFKRKLLELEEALDNTRGKPIRVIRSANEFWDVVEKNGLQLHIDIN